jgi:hypothetical protein
MIKKIKMEADMSALSHDSPLPFDLEYIGKRLTAVGGASAFILNLSEEQREQHHRRVAISCALSEPGYLDTATLTLRTALMLHEIVQPRLLDVH